MMTLSPERNAGAIAYTRSGSNGAGRTGSGTVLVTGGSRGIGRSLCSAFAEDGYAVLFFYLENHDAARTSLSSLEKLGCHSEGFCVDVADHDAVTEAFARLDEARVELSVLVNCAGITLDRTVPKLTPQLWQRVLDANLTGCFNCSQAALGRMRELGYGRIVNI